HKELAKLIIREGKPFRTAALELGYSQNTADNGLKDMRERTPGFAQALEEESKRIPDSKEVLALSVQALVKDMQNGKSRGLERTVETLGKLKIYDWFVRQSETNIGILVGLAENQQSPESPVIDILPE